MSSATKRGFTKDSWQTPRNARTLRAFMALRNQEIGARLRELRGGRPQTMVAEAIGVSDRTLQTWEHGDAKPSYRSLQKIAEYFGVTEGYVLEGAMENGDGLADRPTETPDLTSALTSVQAQLDAQARKLDAIAEDVKRVLIALGALPDDELQARLDEVLRDHQIAEHEHERHEDPEDPRNGATS